MHTPSTPTVSQPASATDPRYSTSGILNAQLKEKNRQGLMSTYGGRSGNIMNINKFADAKADMRNPSAVPVLEQLSKLYKATASASNAAGVGNSNTSSKHTSQANINQYNSKVNEVNNLLSSYGVEKSNLVKATGTYNYDKRKLHDDNYGAGNKGQVTSSVSNLGKSGETFNELEQNVKKQKQPTK